MSVLALTFRERREGEETRRTKLSFARENVVVNGMVLRNGT